MLPMQILLALSLLAELAAPAEDPFLRQLALTHEFRSGLPNTIRFTPDGKWILFLRSEATSGEQTLFGYEIATGKTRPLIVPEPAAGNAGLTPAERAILERKRIWARGITDYDVSRDGRRLATVFAGVLTIFDLARLTAGRDEVAPRLPLPHQRVLAPKLSPDGRRIAFVQDWDLWVQDLETGGKARQLTRGGSERLTHGLAEFAAQEEMDRHDGFWWSPDGSRLAFEEADTRAVETFTIQDPAAPQEPAASFAYPRPGKSNARVRLGLVAASGGPVTWVRWEGGTYPYLARVVWPPKGPLTILVQNRAQTEQLLLAVDPASGRTRELLRETDPAWLNLPPVSRDSPVEIPLWLPDGSGFFWMTERQGAWEAELRYFDGRFLTTWIRATDGLVSLAGFDPVERALYFHAAPEAPDTLIMRVREGGRPERVMAGPPRVTEHLQLSPDGTLRVLRSQSLTGLAEDTVLDRHGKVLGRLPSAVATPLLTPRVELRQVGEPGFWSFVVRPRDAAPGRKLPVVVSGYGGPRYNMVRSAQAAYFFEQWLADQGFMVVGFDGRGTPRRGREWERAIRGNFAGVVLDDQVEALRALAAGVPELDLSRVGIVGWSFGGYLAALAVLKRPDVFHAAVAGAPVVDWLDYDTHYTERYLGIPSDTTRYGQSSLLTWATGLRRPLLIVHGTSDDNVYFFHSLKLSQALFRAGRPHQILPLSGFTHLVTDPVMTERLWSLERDFFRERLAIATP